MEADADAARPSPSRIREPAVVAPPPRAQSTEPARSTRPVPAVDPEPARTSPPPSTPAAAPDIDATTWPDLVAGLALRGPAKELGAHAAFVAYAEGVLRLSLPPTDDHLKAPFLVQQLADALGKRWGAAPQIRFEALQTQAADTLHARNSRERDARQSAAENAFLADPNVQRLMAQQGAKLVPDSIRPYDES